MVCMQTPTARTLTADELVPPPRKKSSGFAKTDGGATYISGAHGHSDANCLNPFKGTLLALDVASVTTRGAITLPNATCCNRTRDTNL